MNKLESKTDRKFEKVESTLHNLGMRMDFTEPRAIEALDQADRLK